MEPQGVSTRELVPEGQEEAGPGAVWSRWSRGPAALSEPQGVGLPWLRLRKRQHPPWPPVSILGGMQEGLAQNGCLRVFLGTRIPQDKDRKQASLPWCCRVGGLGIQAQLSSTAGATTLSLVRSP